LLAQVAKGNFRGDVEQPAISFQAEQDAQLNRVQIVPPGSV